MRILVVALVGFSLLALATPASADTFACSASLLDPAAVAACVLNCVAHVEADIASAVTPFQTGCDFAFAT